MTEVRYITRVEHSFEKPLGHRQAVGLYNSVLRYILCIRGWRIRDVSETFSGVVVEAVDDKGSKILVRLKDIDEEVELKEVEIKVESGDRELSARLAAEITRFVLDTADEMQRAGGRN